MATNNANNRKIYFSFFPYKFSICFFWGVFFCEDAQGVTHGVTHAESDTVTLLGRAHSRVKDDGATVPLFATGAGMAETPLWIASGNGHVPEVEELLRVPGIDVNAEDEEEVTPLMHACLIDNAEMATTLVKAGADVNDDILSSGVSALEAAVVRGRETCVALLISAGADIPERVIAYAKVHDKTNILKMLKCARSW